MSKEHIRPAPMLTNVDDLDDKYIAASCPTCGKYPGADGWQYCQYCDRWIEANGQWSKPRKWWQIWR